VDVALADGRPLLVVEDRDRVHLLTVVEPSTAKGLAVERERVSDRDRAVSATLGVVVSAILGVVIAALVFFDHDREVDLDRVLGLQSTGGDLGGDPGVDDQGEAVGVDRPKRAADRRLLGCDALASRRRDPTSQAGRALHRRA
jgi:hypothetical protein